MRWTSLAASLLLAAACIVLLVAGVREDGPRAVLEILPTLLCTASIWVATAVLWRRQAAYLARRVGWYLARRVGGFLGLLRGAPIDDAPIKRSRPGRPRTRG